ncbi:MAG TPA: hypothetical protein VM925_34805, partial [Labilithrix sp.]|nr:hypothetical protein [Labilithrix sp.]
VDGQSSIHVGFSRIGDGGRVVLLTKNRADGDRKVELTQFFDEMSMSTSRDAFYQTLLHRTMKRTEGSGLGLGRIHAEAEMDLSYQFEGDYVYLRAEANIPTLGGRL